MATMVKSITGLDIMQSNVDQGVTMTPELTEFGKQFITSYYDLYDGGRDERMKNFYNDESKLQFGDDKFTGREAIYKRFRDIPYEVVKHDRQFLDVTTQCITEPEVLVLAAGHLTFGDEQTRTFMESFKGERVDGTYIIKEQVFRFLE